MTLTIDTPVIGPAAWDDLPLTPEHRALLESAAITPEVAKAVGVYSVTSVEQLPPEFASYDTAAVPALVFPYRSPNFEVRLQLRPDVPVTIDGKPSKYLWPAETPLVLNALRLSDNAGTVLIVEGTKQALAAASHAPTGVAVLGMVGCRGWFRDGAPSPDLAVCDDRDVVIVLDADAATNLEVYTAGTGLAEAVTAEGARSVRFVRLPGGKKTGLDDILGTRAPDRRAAYLARLIETAGKKPADRAPKPKKEPVDTVVDPGAVFFEEKTGLLVERLSEAVRDRFPAALTEERKVAMYRDGVYHTDGTAFAGAVVDLLGDRFRPGHRAAAEEFTAAKLFNLGIFLPVHNDYALLNCHNGMLDLATGTLKPHDPSYLSGMQIPIEWDEHATCPTYLYWAEICGVADQLEDLEEVTSTMLDPSRTPTKAVFLFGPSRSGKSTFLRLMQYMVGTRNFSAVTLHQLVANRFAAANVFGKMLNCAADLSAAHVEDISIFKMMTGEDPIQADRKYGGQFTFINRALFAFSANELPTVGESSRAYAERVKPFNFPISFAGREKPEIEAEMMKELPGILVRWVKAWQRRMARGSFLPTDPRVQQEFEKRSDRVRQWLSECCTVWAETPEGRTVGHGTTLPAARSTEKAKLAQAFNSWAEANKGSSMGRQKIIDRLLGTPGVFEVRQSPTKKRALNITVRDESGDVWDDDDPSPNDSKSATKSATGGSFEAQSGTLGGSGGSFAEAPIGAATSEETASGGKGGSFEAETPCSEKHTTRRARNHVDLDTEGEEGGVCLPVESFAPETATFATRATKPPPETGAATTPSEYDRVDLSTFEQSATIALPDGVVTFDIESAGNQLFPKTDGFIRITGLQVGDRIRVTADSAEAARQLAAARMVVGHNIMSFDFPAFAQHHGLDIHAMAREGRIVDTMLTEIVINPPVPQEGQKRQKPRRLIKRYALDKLGRDKFGEGKVDHLPELAAEFGGFDRIPVDERRYVTYCAGDVDLTSRLAKSQPRTEYVKREHRVAAIATQITLNGFRVDVPELHRRVEEGNQRKREQREHLFKLGMPQEDAKGKPFTYPHRTNPGKELIARLFAELGVEPRYTDKGNIALDGDNLAEMVKQYADRPEVLAIIEPIQALNGVRTVYETALEHLKGDRVHPQILMVQASGRWSVIDPGLTVFGKRAGRYHEREIFIPEPGHVIISADLAQVDARAVAAWCQDHAYLDLFEPGRDSHTEIAVKVWGDPGRRQDAKVIGHGWNYGMGVNKLAQQCGSEEAAREFDTAMREQFPRLVAWKDQVREQAKAGPLDNGFGRIMRCEPGWEYTQAPALMGQGAARDLMMEGLLRLPVEILPMLRAVVHDEIVLSIPEDQADDIERAVLDALTFEWAPPGASRPVRIEAGLGERRGRNWGHVYAKEPK